MSAKFPLLLLALAACADDPIERDVFASPADGQSAFATDGVLTVSAPLLAVPGDYPTPQAIRVVDLATDGFVDGTAVTNEGILTFTPDRPWRSDARYAWTVDVPDSLPHGPQFEGDARVEGAAVFDTSDSLMALTAGRLNDQLCVVLSRTATNQELSEFTLDLDDVPSETAVFGTLDPSEWQPSFAEMVGDSPGLGVVCADADEAAFARLYTSEDDSSLVEISTDSPAQLVEALYRRAQ